VAAAAGREGEAVYTSGVFRYLPDRRHLSVKGVVTQSSDVGVDKNDQRGWREKSGVVCPGYTMIRQSCIPRRVRRPARDLLLLSFRHPCQ
jgi:hypothetical protein